MILLDYPYFVFQDFISHTHLYFWYKNDLIKSHIGYDPYFFKQIERFAIPIKSHIL